MARITGGNLADDRPAGAVPGAMRFASLIRLHGDGVDDAEGVSHVPGLTASDNIIAVIWRSKKEGFS